MLIIKKENTQYQIGKAIPISIPQNFNEKQANAFTQDYATTHKCYDVTENKSEIIGCRCDVVRFIPHCNGTHTEGLGHISKELVPINKLLNYYPMKALLITAYPTDNIIKKETILDAINLSAQNLKEIDALIVRCFNEKNMKDYPYVVHTNPPYFSSDAIEFISENFNHLLTDLPSIDKQNDLGALANHLKFFMLPETRSSKVIYIENSNKIQEKYKRTITELCYFPLSIKDGPYFLQIQCLNWNADAAPSNPVIYEYT